VTGLLDFSPLFPSETWGLLSTGMVKTPTRSLNGLILLTNGMVGIKTQIEKDFGFYSTNNCYALLSNPKMFCGLVPGLSAA